MKYMFEGNEDEALKILSRKNLESATGEADIVDSWFLRADLLKNQKSNGKDLEECYDNVIKLESNFRNNFLAGNYFYERLLFKKAETCFNLCLKLSKDSKDKVKALIQLGNLYSSSKRLDESLNVFNEALKIYESFIEKGEKSYLMELAGTLNNLGNLHSDLLHFSKAEKDLKEALKIRRSLLVLEGETNEIKSDIATTLNNLGTLYGKQGMFDKVEVYFKESLEIYQLLAKDVPSLFTKDVIMSLGNLATLYKRQSQYEKAEKRYIEAYDLLEELSKGGPKVFLQQKIDLLFNWSILLKDKSLFTVSENKLNEALKIIKALSYLDEDAFSSKKASILQAFGNLYSLQNNRSVDAEKYYNMAIETVLELIQKNPKAHLFNLLNVLISSAVFFEKQNKAEKAEKNYYEALSLIEGLNDESVLYFDYVSKIKYNLGRLQVSQGNLKEAQKNYNDTIEIRSQLIIKNRFSYLNDLGMSLEGMALLQIELGKKELALKKYSKATDIYRELVKINFDVYSYGLSNVLTNFAVLHYEMENYDSSEKMYQEALEIRRRLAKENPQVYSQGVAVTLFNIANLLKDQGKIDEAEEKYLEAIKFFKQLAESNPDQFNLFLAKNLVGLSLFYLHTKIDKEKCLSYCREADTTLNDISPNPEVLSLRQHTEAITKAWGS